MRTLLVKIISVAIVIAGMQSAAAQETGWVRHTIDDSSSGADGVRLDDVNGDGLPDIATGWEQGGTVRLYVNPGSKKSRQP